MIVSFYDINFKGLQNNAALVIDKDSYKLIKRPIEYNDLTCICEAFTEDIQPAFLVIKNDLGKYVYGSLSGIPVLNSENKTEITGTDLKSMLASDIVLTLLESCETVGSYLNALFAKWKTIIAAPVELIYENNADAITLTSLKPTTGTKIVNVWEEIKSYLAFYDLYIDSKIDLVNKKIIYTIGKTMLNAVNVRLWEYGIRNYGKWITTVNETQGIYGSGYLEGTRFILLKNNNITSNTALRDIYPVKKKLFYAETREEADREALTNLLDSLYNENIDIKDDDKNYDFTTACDVYIKRGGGKYKTLPIGELEYDINGLIRYQIGYRYTGVEYI